MPFKDYAKEYLAELKLAVDKLPLDELAEVVQIMRSVSEQGGTIYVIGNGGSAATASHFVCDFAKGCNTKGKRNFKVIGLTDNVPMITALSNDLSYDEIFAGQLEPLLDPGDLVIAFTGSGNSRNILRAVEYANSVGARSIAFTGFDGGKVKALADKTLIVPSNNMERTEDVHLIIEHLIHLYLMDEISAG